MITRKWRTGRSLCEPVSTLAILAYLLVPRCGGCFLYEFDKGSVLTWAGVTRRGMRVPLQVVLALIKELAFLSPRAL